MNSNHASPLVRRAAVVAGLALVVSPAVASAIHSGPDARPTYDEATIAEAKSGLDLLTSEHADDAAAAAVFLPAGIDCPVLPTANLVWFANDLGIEVDHESAFASIGPAERIAPDLVAVTPGGAAPSSAPAASDAAVVDAPTLVTTCGFGVPAGSTDGGAATPTISAETTTPETTAESVTGDDGLVPAEGLLLRVAAFDDSTFADDVATEHPDAEVVSPSVEGLDGEIVGHCAAAPGAAADACTVWWHQDGLGIGVELAGPTATFANGSATVQAMTPSVIATLRAAATGETPVIPTVAPDVPDSEPPASEPPLSEPPVSEPPASEPPASEPPIHEIEIPAGEQSITVEGVAEPGVAETYSFWTDAGQTIELSLTAVADNAAFSLYAPNGDRLVDSDTTFAGPAVGTGLFALEITSLGGTAEYTLTLTITGEPAAPATSTPG